MKDRYQWVCYRYPSAYDADNCDGCKFEMVCYQTFLKDSQDFVNKTGKYEKIAKNL